MYVLLFHRVEGLPILVNTVFLKKLKNSFISSMKKVKKLKQCPLSGWFIKIIAHSEDETKD